MQGVGSIGHIKQFQTKDGKMVAQLSLAFNENDNTLWLDAVAFGKTAEVIIKYFKKGNRIEFVAKPSMDEYTDKNGTKRKKFSLILEKIGFIDKKERTKATFQKAINHNIEIDEDNIPF